MDEVLDLLLGVYATPDDRDRLADRMRTWLAERPGVRDWELRILEAHEPVSADGGLSVGEMYEDLVEQWHSERPGRHPGDRALYELHAEVTADAALLPDLADELPRLACPDLVHSGPCAVPWATASWLRETG